MPICGCKVFKKISLVRDLSLALKGCAATIGNFDGLHLGHRCMIEDLIQRAKCKNLIPTVVTFEPLPQWFFAPYQPSLRLTTLRQKLELLSKMGVEQVVCLRFNAAMASTSAIDFVEKVLVKSLDVKYLMVGEDFRFGFKQTGNVQLLKQLAAKYDYELCPTPIVKAQEHKISSTGIRLALAQGNVKLVKAWLGRHYAISYRVVHGEKRGRTLNFPTANLPLKVGKEIFKGVFVTRVLLDQKPYFAVTNVGTRPTVDGKSYLAEVHILDFSENIYGKRLTVEFLHKIRDEKRFNSLELLTQQIYQDIQEARIFLKNNCLEPEYEHYD